MTIEQSLDKLADAINHLADALTGVAHPSVTTVEKADPKPEKAKPAGKSAQAEKAAPAPAAPTAPAAEAAAQPAKAETSDAPLDFRRDIAPLFLDLVAKKGQEAGRAIIDAYDASKSRLSEAVAVEQYPDLLLRLKAALEA